MAVEMRCPNCAQVYGLTDEQAPQYAGRTITCTNCGKPFVAQVPGYAAAAAAPPPLSPPAPQTAFANPGYESVERFHQRQETNGLAIASLVSGVIGFIVPFIPGLLAILLGIFGLSKTRNPRVGGKGMAIAGITLGAVGLLFSLLLLSILFPALNRAREQGNRIKCASNLRQIGLAAQMYANDNRGQLPPDFATILKTQDLTPEVFVCPSTNHVHAPGATVDQQVANLLPGKHLSYEYFGAGMNYQAPADAIIAVESSENHDPGRAAKGQQAGGNVLFADGHVDYVSDLKPLVDEVRAGHNPPRPPGKRQ